MDKDRRNFLKQTGWTLLGGSLLVTTFPLLTPKKLHASKAPQHLYAFIVDIEKCIGCGNCVKACKDENMVPKKSLYSILEETAKDHPNKEGFIFMDYKFTYKEIGTLSNKLANALIELGVKKGDRIATFLPNSIQHTIAFFGIIKAGATSVPANVMFKPAELAYELKDTSAKIIITLDMLYPVVSEAVKNTNVENIIVTSITDFIPGFKPIDLDGIEAYSLMELVNNADEKPPRVDINPKDDLVLILYTAGTTGVP